MTHMWKSVFPVLFVVWTLYNVCLLHVKLLCVLSLQYFENEFVVSSFCFCAVFILLLLHISVFFYLYITYSTSCYCCHYKPTYPWNVCVCVCVCVCVWSILFLFACFLLCSPLSFRPCFPHFFICLTFHFKLLPLPYHSSVVPWSLL
jgi:hypothetical protein